MDIELIKKKIWCKYLYRIRSRGRNLFADIRAELRNFSPSIIFDVGANIGQSALEYTKRYPKATIYSFEPSITNYAALERNIDGKKNVCCFNYALGNTNGTGILNLDSSSDRYHLVKSGAGESIQIKTLESVFEELKLSRINFLKIDTEGHDMEVLSGGTSLIDEAKIDIIQVECSMNITNKEHARFEEFKLFFAQRNYLLYNIYEQTPNWTTGEPFLRRANAVFISADINASNVVNTPW